MDFKQRQACISNKLKNYTEEVSALKPAGISYQLGFGFLLLILFPVMLLEILLVFLFGKDLQVFVPTTSFESPKLIENEVPELLRDLIPMAKKFGISDDVDRDNIMKAASPDELIELEDKVTLRQQEISDWLNTFPETGISDTASFFLYLGSACDEIPLYKSKK